MRFQRNPSALAIAFTRIELVVILGIVALVIGLSFPGTKYFRERSIRTRCAANVAKTVGALRGYANDHEGMLPDCTRRNPEFYGPWWPWEIHTNLTAVLEGYGARREHYYCPANADMNNDAHWDFGALHHSPVRVTGYLFLLNGTRDVQHELRRTNIFGANGKPPAKTELVADIVASQRENYVDIRGILRDRSSHVDGSNPLGGNIGFEDGHVEWRDYKLMNHQIRGAAVWDF